jgi:hypothetical protein
MFGRVKSALKIINHKWKSANPAIANLLKIQRRFQYSTLIHYRVSLQSWLLFVTTAIQPIKSRI